MVLVDFKKKEWKKNEKTGRGKYIYRIALDRDYIWQEKSSKRRTQDQVLRDNAFKIATGKSLD